MSRIVVAAVFALFIAVPALAKKVDKPHVLKGCLEAHPDGKTFDLIGGKKQHRDAEIVEAAHGVDLASAVGHQVSLSGTELIFKPGDRTVISTKRHQFIRADRIEKVGKSCR